MAKERPILFSAPMVNAVLNGSKTQTRRVIKPQPTESDGEIYSGHINGPELYEPAGYDKHGEMIPMPEIYGIYDDDGEWGIKFPYGKVGDQLWVRETYYAFGKWVKRWSDKKQKEEWHFLDFTLGEGLQYKYVADVEVETGKRRLGEAKWHKRPAIFMPRRASRIQLEITGVRVERLQEISAADCIAEGIKVPVSQNGGLLLRLTGKFPTSNYIHDPINATFDDFAIAEYASLIDSINGAGTWAANPLVWVVEFKVIKP